MTIIDANVLVYGNIKAADWLSELLASGETIRLPWVTTWAFIRISTNSRVCENPKPVREVFEIVGEWLVRDQVAAGPLVTDALLAALAI